MKILIATGNAHKVEEIVSAYEALYRTQEPFLSKPISFLTLKDFPTVEEPDENGSTFLDNARIKCWAYRFSPEIAVLADDSGLVIPSLNGAPGVHSARYAGVGASAEQKIQKVLTKLNGKKGVERKAHFETVMVLLLPHALGEVIGAGRVEGMITETASGGSGFGYDPIFVPEGYEKSFAQMSLSDKNKISHRSRALGDLFAKLEKTY
jgi:XTP/dITP diphosphohydrolase